jgi:hypothetical protein
MALLAVPTVDGGFTSYRTPIQILSYVSTTASVGSILTGLFLCVRRATRRAIAFAHARAVGNTTSTGAQA